MRIVKIKSIKRIKNESKRYDIETKKNHNFFANNILVHNSLGILFYNPIKNRYELASRGSFESDQAIRGTRILQNKYPDLKVDHDKYTFLFEIIYPENRIVVDYGDEEDLILLAVIENDTGKEVNLSNNIDFWESQYIPLDLEYVEQYKFDDWRDLDKLNWKNAEGFVVRFLDNDIRVKIKFGGYKSLHKILCGLNEKLVFEWTKNNFDCSSVVDKLPADKQKWIADLQSKFSQEYCKIENKCKELIRRDGHLLRKEFAVLHKDEYFSSVLFAMLDGKKWEDAIWKIIEKDIK